MSFVLNSFNSSVSSFWKYIPILCNDNISTSTTYTRIISLKPAPSILWGHVRKSYRSLINWGLGNMNFIIADHSSPSLSLFDEYKNLHVISAGRQTRSNKSWQAQYDAILNSQAFLVNAYIDSRHVGSSFFTINNSHCYYASAAYDRSLFNSPIAHAVIWHAMLYAKNHSIFDFEIGEDSPGWDIRLAATFTQKQKNIMLFKSGFGGALHPLVKVSKI